MKVPFFKINLCNNKTLVFNKTIDENKFGYEIIFD